MHSVATGVIFYYETNDGTILLLQERSDALCTPDSRISITGGYLNGKTCAKKPPENIITGLRREIREEFGVPFEKAIKPNAFTQSNVAYIRHCAEQNPAGGMQSNIQLIWTLRISKKMAKLAIAKDKAEVKAIMHIQHNEIHLHPCSWLPEVANIMVKSGHLPPPINISN